MSADDRPWILDTSVAAAWFLTDEPLRDEALAVRSDLARHPDRYLTPPLFHSELVHVLTQRSGRDEGFVKRGIELVLRLGIRTLMLSEAALLRAPKWACAGLGGYDATFVALAEDLRGRWLTADERAAGLASRHAVTLASWARARRA